jgi:glycosyltransferase involved in cell wall biosynthesis
MRISYLINQYPKVSHSFIRREILALEQQGLEVTRISLRGWDLPLVDAQDSEERKRTRFVLRDGALPLIAAFMRMLFARPGRLVRALALAWKMSRHSDRPLFVHFIYVAEACRIESWLREAGVQHLHAHFGTNSTEVAMLVHALGGPPWSFTIHGPEEFERGASIGLKEKLRRCTFAVAISSYGRSQLYRLMEPESWPKAKVVHCGLDTAFHSGRALAAPTGRRLLCVGRLSAEKGHMLLIAAAQRLAEQETDFELVLAGDGDQRPAIEALIARSKLQGRVRITGWLSADEVRAEMLAARALVLSSLAEGLPVVIMEAMALGRPVIAPYMTGIPELVHPGEHGWLVPAGHIGALARAMQACLDAPDETLARMGEAARERVLARHDADNEAAKLAKLFRGAPMEEQVG